MPRRLKDYPKKLRECMALDYESMAWRFQRLLHEETNFKGDIYASDFEKFAQGMGNPLQKVNIVPQVFDGYSGFHFGPSNTGLETVAHFTLVLPDETLTGRDYRPGGYDNLERLTRTALATLVYLAENKDARYPQYNVH